jgi:hypothetical protein
MPRLSDACLRPRKEAPAAGANAGGRSGFRSSACSRTVWTWSTRRRRAGVTRALHLCERTRAGGSPRAGYEDLSQQVFSGPTNFDVSVLEYDGACSGSFEPFRNLPGGKTGLLGPVSTKRSCLEPADDPLGRIEEASRYASSDQCACGSRPGGRR